MITIEESDYTDGNGAVPFIPPLNQLRRSVDVAQMKVAQENNSTGPTSARGSSTKGTIPFKKLIAENKYLQIQIQCSSALDKSAFR